MKNRYFRFVEINKKVISNFLNRHQDLTQFIDINKPFYIRISKKPFAGLIHSIVSQDESNQAVSDKWMQLINCVKKINPKNICNLISETLNRIVGEQKAKLIHQISFDVKNKLLNLKKLITTEDELVIDRLKQYSGLTINTIKIFSIFSLFKNDMLCYEDINFIEGLKIYLNKQNISQEDINSIKIKYRGEATLFSLCMWKIKNERVK